jgi:hypothetical protein
MIKAINTASCITGSPVNSAMPYTRINAIKAKNRLSAACFMRVQEFLIGLQRGDC